MLVANKIDLIQSKNEPQDIVESQLGRKLAEEHSACFLETSAYTGENVNRAFEMICEEILIDRFPQSKEY